MKYILIILLMGLGIGLFAQSTAKTQTLNISVKGNCEQCKERIENAADIKGVKLCTWDAKTRIATIIYRTDKTTPEKIQTAIARSGHDTELVKASPEDYDKLPGCCKYREGACKEH